MNISLCSTWLWTYDSSNPAFILVSKEFNVQLVLGAIGPAFAFKEIMARDTPHLGPLLGLVNHRALLGFFERGQAGTPK